MQLFTRGKCRDVIITESRAVRQDTKALQLFRKAEEFWILNMNHTVMRRIAPSLCDFLNPHTMLSDKFYSLPLPAEFCMMMAA